MSLAVSKTERFLRYGPYILWFGMNAIIGLALVYQRGLEVAIYYLTNFVFLGSFVIWHFGFRVFPIYLENDGKINSKLLLAILINIMVFTFSISLHLMVLNYLEIESYTSKYPPISIRIAIWILMILLGMVIMASTRIARVYHQNMVKEIGKEMDRVQAELQLLKSQISPHFLFNTLNNIYGLAYLKDERAAQMISKLSQIMRYLIDDCNQPKVPLLKEKEMIDHYLSLQLLKYDNAPNIDFYQAGIKNKHEIVPMILINFIENCFKHSDLETNLKGWVKVYIELEGNELTLQTRNTIKKEYEKILFERKGIGQTNSIKLLEANYTGRYKVDITNEENVYKLDLKVTL